MKLLSVGTLICAIASFFPQSGSSQDAKPLLHMIPAKDVHLTADSIIRQDPRNLPGAARYASEILLKGNVQIQLCCVQRELQEKPPAELMIVSADEAVYHADTGGFEAQGTVRVSFEDKMNH